MQRARDIAAGTVLGVVLMLSAINWADGAGLTAALVLGLALQGLALYVAITRLPGAATPQPEAPAMKRATVRFGGKKISFPPSLDEDYHETALTR